jgi:hypothetical protein
VTGLASPTTSTANKIKPESFYVKFS